MEAAAVLLPISTILTAIATWFLAKRKNNAEAKIAEIDAEVKAANFYKALLDDASKRLIEAIEVIKERDKIIKVLDEEKREMQKKLTSLIEEIEILTSEIRKYKQLNGKQS